MAKNLSRVVPDCGATTKLILRRYELDMRHLGWRGIGLGRVFDCVSLL